MFYLVFCFVHRNSLNGYEYIQILRKRRTDYSTNKNISKIFYWCYCFLTKNLQNAYILKALKNSSLLTINSKWYIISCGNGNLEILCDGGSFWGAENIKKSGIFVGNMLMLPLITNVDYNLCDIG